MTTEYIFQDVANLYSRLFDHHPVLQGNINSFLKEFEEKRGNREVSRLNHTNQVTKTINDQILPEVSKVLEDSLPKVVDQVATVTEMIRKITEKDGKVEKPLLAYQRERRKENWEEFLNQQKNKTALVDQDYERQVKVLQDHYNHLETSLNNSLKPVL